MIKEAQRTFTYLNLYGYPTDLVVCNRLIPDDVTDAYFSAWKESQERYYSLVEEGFSPLPILKAPLMDQEVVGLEMLERFGDAIYDEHDPTARPLPGPDAGHSPGRRRVRSDRAAALHSKGGDQSLAGRRRADSATWGTTGATSSCPGRWWAWRAKVLNWKATG